MVLVEVHDVSGGETDVDDAVERGVERGEDLAGAAGLAAAGVAGDESDATHLEQVSEPDLELLGGGGREEILGLDLAGERVLGQSEVLAVHVSPPLGM